jgi:RNA polymerase sigma factor for flagellar operon FliA
MGNSGGRRRRSLALNADQQKLYDSNQDLISHALRSISAFVPKCVQVDSLIQAGRIGLCEAAAKFDPTRGWRFITYAMPRIRGEMIDELRDMDWIPRPMRKAGGPFVISGDHPAVQARDVSPHEITQNDNFFVAMLASDNAQARSNAREDHGFVEAEARDRVKFILANLDEDERQLVSRYYLEETSGRDRPRRLKDIAAELGVTESCVSQRLKMIRAKALNLLRSA